MANVKISELSVATTLTGAESVPVVQGGATVKTTTQDIADLAAGGGGGTANYATAQIIGASGYPSATYDLKSLFPTVTFTDVAVSMNMQIIISDSGGVDTGSFLFNIYRNNSNSPFWGFGAPYSSEINGAAMAPSFMFGGSAALPTVQFYIFGISSASINMTIVTV
tara:strand:+ start:36 stop:533 length:498 start_codon:yes stop_codon:yes gene_type:complete